VRKEMILDEIIDKENLQNDCSYIRKIKDSIRNTEIQRLEEIRREFIEKNLSMSIEDMELIDTLFEYIEGKA
jgi:uncharacterized membrane protein YcaP (DUF421 family)